MFHQAWVFWTGWESQLSIKQGRGGAVSDKARCEVNSILSNKMYKRLGDCLPHGCGARLSFQLGTVTQATVSIAAFPCWRLFVCFPMSRTQRLCIQGHGKPCSKIWDACMLGKNLNVKHLSTSLRACIEYLLLLMLFIRPSLKSNPSVLYTFLGF